MTLVPISSFSLGCTGPHVFERCAGINIEVTEEM